MILLQLQTEGQRTKARGQMERAQRRVTRGLCCERPARRDCYSSRKLKGSRKMILNAGVWRWFLRRRLTRPKDGATPRGGGGQRSRLPALPDVARHLCAGATRAGTSRIALGWPGIPSGPGHPALTQGRSWANGGLRGPPPGTFILVPLLPWSRLRCASSNTARRGS